jgi:hypothetical protein
VTLLSEVIMLTSDDNFFGYFFVDAVLSAHRSMSRQHLCMHIVGHISTPFEFWLTLFDDVREQSLRKTSRQYIRIEMCQKVGNKKGRFFGGVLRRFYRADPFWTKGIDGVCTLQ